MERTSRVVTSFIFLPLFGLNSYFDGDMREGFFPGSFAALCLPTSPPSFSRRSFVQPCTQPASRARLAPFANLILSCWQGSGSSPLGGAYPRGWQGVKAREPPPAGQIIRLFLLLILERRGTDPSAGCQSSGCADAFGCATSSCREAKIHVVLSSQSGKTVLAADAEGTFA